MIAAMSFVVSISIFFRRKSTQCHSHDGNVLSKAQRAHDAYGDRYAPGMRGPSACLKLEPSSGSTPPVLPWNPPQKPMTSVWPVRDLASRIAATYLGWAYPMLATPTPASRSTYRLPSTSYSRAPSPRSIESWLNSATLCVPGAKYIASASNSALDLGPGSES